MEELHKGQNKPNCWEVKNCGRHPRGDKKHELGVCPAATESKVNGIHGGKNGGRCCWAVARTFCKGAVQGTFALKYENCRICSFYQQVIKESSRNGSFILTSSILKILEDY